MKKFFKYYAFFINWLMMISTAGYRHNHVLEKQVELLYRQIPQVISAVVLIATGFTWLFFEKSNEIYALIWLASVYLLSIFRYYFYRLRRLGTVSISVKNWALLGITFSFLSGLQWASTTLIFFNGNSIEDVALLALILLGMISGAVGSLSVIPAAFVGFSAPIVICTIIAMLNSPIEDIQFLSLFIVVFILAYSMFSRNTYNSNMYAINLNIENTDLIKNLEREKENAEKANTAKSKFLASASHDLRQPLQSMSLCAEALKENLFEADNLGLIDRVIRSHVALSDLLNALLDISKLDAGSVEVRNCDFDIAEKLNDISNNILPLAEKNNQQLVISNSRYRVHSDPVIVKRILQNLIANAVRHSPEHTIIIVETKIKNNQCIISIKDNGPGIPEADQELVFNEFHQLKNPERDRDKGLGLGLAIVKRLTNLLDCKLTLQSSLGEGCHFSISLPLALNQQPTQPVLDTVKQTSGRLDNVNVLVVEDEADVREALVMILQRWGCRCWQTDNIKDTLALINQHNFDLLLTDYRLREHETGLNIIDEIKNAGFDIPALLITGDTSAENIQAFNQAGQMVLHKPVKTAELRAAIQYLLN